ncbi:transposase [Micromonospora craniellae]|nr:transposase [Micromonospora craniellae]
MSGLEELSREELIGLTRQLIVQVGQLTRANQELTDRVARLERLVSRNSGNSGMPPSKDDDPGRRPPAEASASEPAAGVGKRSRGKQRGAPGAQLSWSSAADDTVDHFPGGVCGCGSDLASAVDLGVYASHQQVDVPVMTATVTQHDRHAVRCGCGAMHVAARPDGVPDATVSYGPNLAAWCVYLMVVHAIPVARCADLVAALTGSRPSDGFVHALIGRAAAGVAESNRIIRTLIALAHVVSCDETPIRVGARKVKKYLLVACTRLYTWYLLGDRSLAHRRPADRHLPARGTRRTQGGRPGRRPETAETPGAAGRPPRPRGRHPAVHHRPAHPTHLEPGRTRPTTSEDPAEDLRTAHQREGHRTPLLHPRLHLHRDQTPRRRHHRDPRRHPRPTLDTTRLDTRLTHHKQRPPPPITHSHQRLHHGVALNAYLLQQLCRLEATAAKSVGINIKQ